MTVTSIPAHDVRPPDEERYDFRYQHGVSTVFMPNGSAVCVSQNAPTELQVAMTLAWAEAWKRENRRREIDRGISDYYRRCAEQDIDSGD